jgi:hypothetical protein
VRKKSVDVNKPEGDRSRVKSDEFLETHSGRPQCSSIVGLLLIGLLFAYCSPIAHSPSLSLSFPLSSSHLPLPTSNLEISTSAMVPTTRKQRQLLNALEIQ